MKRKDREASPAGELGRLRKKIRDQAGELEEIRRKLEKAYEGSLQLQRAVDALLTAVTLARGEEIIDPERPEKGAERRLEVPFFSVEEMGQRYALTARRGETGYVMEVQKKSDPPAE